MISLLRERNVLGIVCLGGDRSDAFEAPIFGLVLFDTFAVSSTSKKTDMQVWHQGHLRYARYQDKGVQSALFATASWRKARTAPDVSCALLISARSATSDSSGIFR
jgi:hypothetical protein